jgi:hypothetical protein
LKDQDYETIQKLGHGFKGAGAGFGFERITDIGLDIEEAAKVERYEDIKEKLEELIHYLKNIEIVYEANVTN